MMRSAWDRRIERAAELEAQYPAAAELLRFYREIAAFERKGVADSAALLDLVRRHGPPELAQAANDPGSPAHLFFERVLEQMRATGIPAAVARGAAQFTCPVCGEKPVAAVLRVEGEGGKRNLLCPRCFNEWEFRRLLCPGCGEENHEKLPVYTAAEFPHIRIEACDSCRQYIKAIDLTRNGLAVPVVDELASVSLDLWAAEKGYSKLQVNLLGL